MKTSHTVGDDDPDDSQVPGVGSWVRHGAFPYTEASVSPQATPRTCLHPGPPPSQVELAMRIFS